MKVIIRRHIDEIMQEAIDWLRDLCEEHASYYGQPHGRTSVWVPEHEDEDHVRPYWASDTEGYRYGHAGYVERKEAIHLLLDAVDSIENSKLRNDIVEFAMDPSMPIGGWRTSAGNLTLVCGDIEYRSGRRHGVRLAMQCDTGRGDGWFYIETQRPDASPDACGLTENEAVSN